MARTTKTGVASVPDAEETAHAILALAEDTTDAEALNPALANLYAELGIEDGGDAQVFVSKLDADGRGQEAQVWKGDPDQYDLEQIAKKFGSGSYRVKVYVRIPTGQKVLKGNKVFAWLLSPEDEAKRVAAQNPQPLMSKPLDPTEIARAVAEAVRASMPQPTPTQSPSPLEMMREMANVMQMMMPQQQQASMQPVNQLGMLRDMAELLQTLRGDAETTPPANANSNDLLLGLINKFGPMLMQATQQGAPPVHAQASAPQIPHQMGMPQEMPNDHQQMENDMSMKLRMGLTWLIQQCRAGGAPETYAEVVLDSVPAEGLRHLMSSADPVEHLAQFAPEVRAHAQWFRQLLDECKALLEPEQGEPTASSGGSDEKPV